MKEVEQGLIGRGYIARRLGVSLNTVTVLERKKVLDIKRYRIGTKVRYDPKEFERWFAAQEVKE